MSDPSASADAPRYSFVIPVYNEREVLPQLFPRLDALLERLDGPAEVLLVDDGSRDGSVDVEDRRTWVQDEAFAHTYFGDANLDGEFNTNDLVSIFQAGQYEDAIEGNATWETGDWNGDGDFGTADLVFAFQDGGFEQGPRVASQNVPEPSASLLILTAMIGLRTRRR